MTTPFKIKPSHWVLIAALAIAAYACYGLIKPYLGAIVLGFIVSLLFLPLHEKIEKRFKRHVNLAAILSCTLLTVIIIIPVSLVIWSILHQGVDLFNNAYNWIDEGGAQEIIQSPFVQNAIDYANKVLPYASIDTQELIGKFASSISTFSAHMLSISSTILGNLTGVLINFLLMLFVLFFFLRDHDLIIHTVRRVLPLSRSQEDTLLKEIEQVAKSAVLGSFLTAMAQGALGGFAMWMAGFSGLFWGTMMAFTSFIPLVGCALIWFPATLYLVAIGEWQWAAFLGAWGVLVVGSADNFLRPLLMQGNSRMNTLMIFFSLLGGLNVYGLMGLIYGPVIFSLTIALFNMYEFEFKVFLDKQDRS